MSEDLIVAAVAGGAALFMVLRLCAGLWLPEGHRVNVWLEADFGDGDGGCGGDGGGGGD